MDSEPGTVLVLHLEDSPADAELVRRMMELDGLRFNITVASDRAKFEAAVRQKPFDLILCDHGIPGYDGFAALKFARGQQPNTPVIILSGTLDEGQAVESLKSGATDYILKQRLARLIPAIRRALHDAGERKKQHAAAERIQEQANLLNLTSDAIFVLTMDDRMVFWNKGAEMLFGWNSEQALEQPFGTLLHADDSLLAAARKSLIESGNWLGELQLRGRTGEEITVLSRWNLVRDAGGKPQAILSANTDITEKKRLEAIALRAQRMDSIGALAGGIAHDLNNALAPVLMSAELLQNCKDDETRQRLVDIIFSSAQRATGMVKQILSFARGSGGQSGPVKLNHIIREMGKMTQDTFPKSISFSVRIIGKELWTVEGDPTEFHQILLNLCVNARDAMPQGGRLVLSAQNLKLNQEALPANAAPGPYVMISVSDTGSGIPAEVLPHVFEPFFTTKIGDKGTGLGLSTVAGIVKNHGGFIQIETEPGQGTEFKIFLPANPKADVTEADTQEVALPSGHGELILVIEDEEAMRELTKTTLESYGYRVVTAQDGVQGIDRFKDHKDEIKLLVTDTDMPYLDGMGAIRAIKELKPDLPVIIASGSKRDTEQLRQLDIAQLKNLGKPYSLDQLLIAVDAALHP
jgi:two-component system, cell cycle sensor histidine kinase and response regulator CckA